MKVDVKALVTHWALRASFAAVLLCAHNQACADRDLPHEIPVQSWLQGPDRHDFDWKVVVEPPILTFQQRHLVQVHTALSVGKLQKAGVSLKDLHFVVKFAGENEAWFPGQYYGRFVLSQEPRSGDEIHCFANVYLRPGRYMVAVMAYDSLNRRGNLWRSRFQVPVVKNDPLPDLENDLPRVDFLPNVRHFGTGQPTQATSVDPWALGEGRLRLPVNTTSPVQLDVVANLSPSDIVPEHSYYQRNAAFLLQISSVLSQIAVNKGCVRFSAVDILRQRTYADRENSQTVDWNKLRKTIEEVERNAIDVRTLATRKRTPEFFATFLEQVLNDTGACAGAAMPVRHVVVVVSDAFLFPSQAQRSGLPRQSLSGAESYYLRLDPVRGARFDEIGNILKPLHPVQLHFDRPIQFRKALAELTSGIAKAAPDAGSQTSSR